MLPLPAHMTRTYRASRQAISAWRALGAFLMMGAAIPMSLQAQLPTPPDTQRVVNSALGGACVTQ